MPKATRTQTLHVHRRRCSGCGSRAWPSDAAAMGAGEMLANTWLAGRPHASSMLASACRARAPRETARRPAQLQPRSCGPTWRSLTPPRRGLALQAARVRPRSEPWF